MLGNQLECTRWNSLMTCHMESRFGAFGDIVSFGAREVHSLHLMQHGLRNILTHLLVLLGEGAQVDARFGLFGDSANLNAR